MSVSGTVICRESSGIPHHGAARGGILGIVALISGLREPSEKPTKYE